MTSKQVTELVIYQIKATANEKFLETHQAVISELAKHPGFVRFESLQHIQNALIYTDKVIWENEKYALAAFKAFKSFPSSQAFMATIDKVIYSGHFQKN